MHWFPSTSWDTISSSNDAKELRFQRKLQDNNSLETNDIQLKSFQFEIVIIFAILISGVFSWKLMLEHQMQAMSFIISLLLASDIISLANPVIWCYFYGFNWMMGFEVAFSITNVPIWISFRIRLCVVITNVHNRHNCMGKKSHLFLSIF